jgi:nitrogenase molybdenum-iron protein beta chain
LLTTSALPGVVPIMHAAMGCGASIYWNQYGSTGYLGAGYCGGLAAPSSNIQEKDVVFGGLDRLDEQVRSTIEIIEGGLYVILTGCTPDIIGDDINSVVRKFQAEGRNVIGAETGGFRGDGYAGYDIVLSALANAFVTPSAHKKAKKVNLLGVVPGQDAFWRGNLLKLRSLLERLGLEVNSFFTEYDTLDSIQNSGNSSLTILVSEFFGLKAAKAFESAHGIPYCENPFPIGPAATEIFLRCVADRLRIPRKKVDSLIIEETRRYFRYVERIADAYNDLDWQRYAVVVGDANYAPALTKFAADDLGWLPELMVVTTSVSEEDEPRIERVVNTLTSGCAVRVVYETDPTEIKSHFWKYAPRGSDALHQDSFSPAFVIGSHLEREFAADIGAEHLTVSFPVGNRVVMNRGYACFDGSLSLIEDLLSVIAAQR